VWYEKINRVHTAVMIIWLLSTDITLETIHFAYGEITFRVLFGMPEIQLLSMLTYTGHGISFH
jgi:hypothetical protein